MNFSIPGSTVIFGQRQAAGWITAVTPGGMTLSYFSEAPGPEPQPPTPGAGPCW